jgi:RecG-like helicase
VTTKPRPTGFAGLDRPPSWPATRARPRPETLERPLDSLPGVGVALKRKLAKLGLESVRDLLEHRPRRYESAADVVRIADLHRDGEVVIEGEVLSVNARRRGRLAIVTARVSDGSAATSATWFNQPWLAEQLTPGTHVRLRGRRCTRRARNSLRGGFAPLSRPRCRTPETTGTRCQPS